MITLHYYQRTHFYEAKLNRLLNILVQNFNSYNQFMNDSALCNQVNFQKSLLLHRFACIYLLLIYHDY
jgi:hypothetical protein